MDYRRLKWVTVILPVLVVTGLVAVRDVFVVLGGSPLTVGLIAFAALVAGVYIFADRVFRTITGINLRLRQEEERYRQLVRDVAGLLDAERSIHEIVEGARRLLGADLAGWAQVPDGGGPVTWKVLSGAVGEGDPPPPLSRGHGLASHHIRAGQPIRIEDFPRDPAFPPDRFPFLQHQGLRATLAVPVDVRRRVVGGLVIGFRRPHRFLPEEEQLLRGLAGQAAIVLENLELYRDVQHLAVVEERERIAREMHDGLAQLLGLLSAKQQLVRQFLAQGQTARANQELEEIEAILRDAHVEVREGIFNLKSRPAPGPGFFPALADYLQTFARHARLNVEADLPDAPLAGIQEGAELQLMRIIQEALANVRRHAGASLVRVVAHTAPGTLHVIIEDNGRGFSLEEVEAAGGPRFGLAVMRERAAAIGGQLSVAAEPGRGVRIEVEVPLGKGAKALGAQSGGM